MDTAKRYHSPGRIATSFISGLWLGWASPTNTSGSVQKPSRGRAQSALEANGCRRSLDRKSDLFTTFSSQRL